jgi:hypothetical protein
MDFWKRFGSSRGGARKGSEESNSASERYTTGMKVTKLMYVTNFRLWLLVLVLNLTTFHHLNRDTTSLGTGMNVKAILFLTSILSFATNQVLHVDDNLQER